MPPIHPDLRPNRRLLARIWILAPVWSGCDPGDPGAQSLAWDSAGIEIVESVDGGRRAWSVADDPILEIGVGDGDAAYQLHHVQGVRRLTDGRIVVAHGGSQQLRFYDDAGRFLRATGRRGAGPGEFGYLSLLAPFEGDSLIAFDGRHERATIIDPAGEPASTFTLAAASSTEAMVTLVGATGNGVLVGRRARPKEARADGYRRDDLEFLVLPDPQGEGVSLGTFPGLEFSHRESSPSPGIVNVQQASMPFARSTDVAAAGERVFIGTNDTFEVREFGLDGSLRRLIRRTDVAPRQVERRALDEYIESVWAEMGAGGSRPDQTSFRNAILELPRVPSMPSYAGLLMDELGSLWVRHYWVPWKSDGSQHWSVFDGEGRLVGTGITPPGLEVHQAGVDFVLGVATTELGVERVRMYRLVR